LREDGDARRDTRATSAVPRGRRGYACGLASRQVRANRASAVPSMRDPFEAFGVLKFVGLRFVRCRIVDSKLS